MTESVKVRRLRVLIVGTWMALAGLQAPIASAQSSVTTGIIGTVHDGLGGAVKGAQITVRNLDNDETRSVTSDAAGKYEVPNLAFGPYEITTEKYGFSQATTRVLLRPDNLVHADFELILATQGTDTAASAEARKLEALEARVEQLESERQTTSLAEQIPRGQSAPDAQQRGAKHGPLLATLGHEGLQLAIAPAASAPADLNSGAGSGLPSPGPSGAPQAAAPPQSTTPSVPPIPEALQAPEPGPAVDNFTPFAFGDFTWLNGSPRNKDTVLDTKFFTPEVRFDSNFIIDFNQPIDHSMGGSTEEFRSGEVQIEQASVGGDFHWDNVRGRILFMNGLFSSTTPRNDASSPTGSAPGDTGGVGQWDLQSAYKYISEAYGGYHFNVNHGLNVDAGIFVSYIGLFSYYNFDNWTYQPSYVSSNTPWFFDGVRIQWFPTARLKIEPWIVNGWQSYAKFNSHLGLGGQLLWMPNEWFKLVANQYGFGEDNLGLPHTQRIHTDDSIEVRYYSDPESLHISKMALSLTADAGCQYGGGIHCLGAPSDNKESFVGWMLYDRTWFHKDLFAVTLGGGDMSNFGRYLTLLPPIDGAWAASGTPYFTENPGQRAHMWDSTLTLNYMPKEYLTWWFEAGYRHSDVPYFSGRGGITPPGGNNGLPQYYTCTSGATAGTADLAAAQVACGGAGDIWYPDLRRSTSSIGAGVMVKF